MKSYWTSLGLLMVGGVFGLHHFYLGRTRHAIFNLFTFGGGLFGVFHDLIRLGFYVNWANFDADFKEEFVARTRKDPRPPLGMGRGVAMVVAAQMLSNLLRLAIPVDLLHPVAVTVAGAVLVPSSIAVAVWYVGCIGETRGPFRPLLRTAMFTSPLYVLADFQLLTALVCVYRFRSTWTYRPAPENPGSVAYRIVYVGAIFTAVFLLFSSAVLFNCTIEDPNQGEIRCRDALRHFFNSPLWQNIVDSLRQIRSALLEGGFTRLTETLVVLMDPTGEQHALKVLGVSLGSSDADIRQAYRNLSRKFHPDKNKAKSPEEREDIERRFREVQEAFETLQLRKGRRNEEEIPIKTE